MTLVPKFEEALRRIKLPKKPIIKIPEIRSFDLIMLILAIVGVSLGAFGIYEYIGTSQQNANLTRLSLSLSEQNSFLQHQLSELNQSVSENFDEIKWEMYSITDISSNKTSINDYTLERWGITYDEMTQILKHTSSTDYYALGISSLSDQDYNASLDYFNMDLFKNPSNINSKIGKVASLIGLNRTNEGRSILFDVESNYNDKAYIDKLFGDSYYNDGDYKNATDYYLSSGALYSLRPGIDESKIDERLWYIRYYGLYNASNIDASILPMASGGYAKSLNVRSNYSAWGWIEL